MGMTLFRHTYMGTRDSEYPTTEEMEVSCARLLWRVNKLIQKYKCGFMPTISSGYRPGHYNAKYSPKSAHVTCEAVDIADQHGGLKSWIMANPDVLEECDLYMEHPSATPSWCHLSTRPPASGKRVFMP